MKLRGHFATSIAGLALAACSSAGASPSTSMAVGPPSTTVASPSAPSAAADGDLTIYAAASLKAALEKAKAAYETANPGTTITLSTGSSTALETQIEQGAPADVFLSADAQNPRMLVDKALTDGDPVSFAGNTLVIVVPTDNPAGITSPKDLARSGVKVIAAGDEVPITKYAKQLVDDLAKEGGYPTGFAAAYAANVASKEEDVRSLMGKIELGEGDAGIVYVTDAKASGKVQMIDVPDSANVRATYDGVVLKASRNPSAAKAFLDWLVGPEGQAILRGLGFLPPS